MMTDYELTQFLSNDSSALVYRAIRLADKQNVVLKLLIEEYPAPAVIARYQQEYEIVQSLSPISGVIRVHGLDKHNNNPFLIFEDFGGEPLHALYAKQALALSEFFPLALEITRILGEVHAANVIHKDINPNNILRNPESGQVKLIDFSLASRLPRETPALQNLTQLEGTLAYLSPEQTGRMNRSLDYRTDFYSLGVTFYELLTGSLPFQATDALELVHCHLAKAPVPPDRINPRIPAALSAIILKLMAKTAEERYQSAAGLAYDLAQCQRQFAQTGEIADFPLGQQDFSDRFHLPQKLYGREAEINELLDAFSSVAQGESQLFLVSGYSGIGKSALAGELHKSITEKRGYFIRGKFDQFQHNVPYSAVVQAFRELVWQLLTEPEAGIAAWKSKLSAALGNNAQVIIDVIGELEWIIGPQPAVPALSPGETQNRFDRVFQDFIRVFCQPEHPLVIFLDDLQWVDSASLKLMRLMMSDIPYLLLIVAYRDNEVSAAHPLMNMLADLRKQGSRIHSLALAPLGLADLNALISDMLRLPPAQTAPLAELVQEKTGGNPFFMGEFLKTLYVEGLLAFHLEAHQWQWNIAQIQARNITENVVELMTGKIARLGQATQNLLKLAASLGNTFDLATLAAIAGSPPEMVKSDLWAALLEGLIAPLAETYKFVHDRVQQAAYSLIPEAERPALHWRIGHLLAQHTGEAVGDRIFELADHFNQGSALASKAEEKIQLARFNLQAAQKAKLASAYPIAADYLNLGSAGLSQDVWQQDYALALAYYSEWLQVMYLCGEFARMEEQAETILRHARNEIDKMKVYEVRVQAYAGQFQLLKAIQTVREGLSLFGVALPKALGPADIGAALTETAAKWQNAPVNRLLDLPRMHDPRHLATMNLLSMIIPASYLGMPELFPWLIGKMVNLSIDHGHCDLSPYAYANYGVVLAASMDIEHGYEFGQLSFQLSEHLNLPLDPRAFFAVIVYVNPWKKPLALSTQSLKELYHPAIEQGALEFLGYVCFLHLVFAYFSGESLAELERLQSVYIHALKKYKQDSTAGFLEMYARTLLGLSNLQDTQADTGDAALSALEQANDSFKLALVYTNRLMLDYLLERFDAAQHHAGLARTWLAKAGGHIGGAVFHFYDSLLQLARYPGCEPGEQADILKQVAANQEKMKIWASHAPMNFQHKYDLVAAGLAHLSGQAASALATYEKAIAGARDNGYLQETALAYELAGKCYAGLGLEKAAQAYLQEAARAYQGWGASLKARQLQENYPAFFPRPATVPGLPGTRHSAATTTSAAAALDIDSLLKASQTLSGEIVLHRLLEKMMRLVIENAGAEQGFLLLPKGQAWLIEAEGRVGEAPGPAVLQSLPADDNQRVSSAIVAAVQRSLEPLVLDDASRQGLFTRDPHILQARVKSVLAVPLKHQGALTGVLYLENNLAVGAFTPAHIEVLKWLASQLAISIENALLYANLEQKVAERTRELSQALAHLQTTQSQLIEAEKMASLGSLVAGVAHEINTPIGIGVTAASTLLAQTDTAATAYLNKQLTGSALNAYFDTARKGSQLLLNNLQRVSELVQSFKQVAVDQTHLEMRVFTVKKYIRETLLSLKPYLKQTPHSIDLTGDETVEINSYPGVFAQIVTNLVTNSLRHAYPDGKAGILRFDVSQAANSLTLEYSDDGCGIAPAHLGKIFEPFFTTARAQGGTGLGLHIVYNLVTQKLQGTIQVRSEPGAGTRFIIRLPLK